MPAAQPTKAQKGKKTVLPLSVPTGTCDPANIDVVPAVRKVDGGSTITLPLKLVSTDGSCTWQASPEALVVKVVSGKDRIWTSQDCRTSVPTQDVVVRPAGEKATVVDVAWTGRRSARGLPEGHRVGRRRLLPRDRGDAGRRADGRPVPGGRATAADGHQDHAPEAEEEAQRDGDAEGLNSYT